MMLQQTYDSELRAILNPADFITPVPGLPAVGFTTYSAEMIGAFAALPGVRTAAHITYAGGRLPVYALPHAGGEVLFYRSLVGAPAAVSCFEELIAMGLRGLVAFGVCGVIDPNHDPHRLILPTAALRDEGTSYHYIPPGERIRLDPAAQQAVASALEALGLDFTRAVTWTNDAIYRETAAKVQARRDAGAVCVEMECAALAAVAAFRGVVFGQFLIPADYVGDSWEQNDLTDYGLGGKDRYLAAALAGCAALPL